MAQDMTQYMAQEQNRLAAPENKMNRNVHEYLLVTVDTVMASSQINVRRY